jgi:hypothetical protein
LTPRYAAFFVVEFESLCKTVLAHESGDPGVQFSEKIEGKKSCETVPLRGLSHFEYKFKLVK